MALVYLFVPTFCWHKPALPFNEPRSYYHHKEKNPHVGLGERAPVTRRVSQKKHIQELSTPLFL